MQSLLEILQKSTEFLAGRGVESARLNTELLVGHALGLKRMELYMQFERLLPEAELEKIRPLIRRRARHEPLQYIMGETEFDDLKLTVDPRVLIPRPETELLVERLAERLAAAPPARILDLGTGSGALALALAGRFPAATVLALDQSEDALAVARLNGERNAAPGARVTWLASDWFAAIGAGETFDLIVSNPPYLTDAEWDETRPEVKVFEPRRALTAPDEGCADLLRIIAEAPRWLNPGGWLVLETGIDQHPRLLAAIAAAGLTDGESMTDLTGRPRFVWARRPGA